MINFKIKLPSSQFVQIWFKDPRNKILLIAVAIMLIMSVIFRPTTSTSKNGQSPIESPDTYIPAGFVLVPIELLNAESLSSLIGDFAIVDLFATDSENNKRKVGQRLKLLRAPLNPQQFAVLVPENETSKLFESGNPLWAAIQNPNQTKNSKMINHQKSTIEFYEGGR